MHDRILITGKAGTGKTRSILRAFLAAGENMAGNPPILLLPTRSQVEHCKELLLGESGGGLIDNNIFTFHTFARSVAAAWGPVIELGRIGRELILSKLDSLAAGSLFRRIAETPGFRETLLSVFRYFKLHLILPENLHTIFGDDAAPIHDRKWREIYSVYAEYQEALRKKGFYDREDILLRALSILREDNTACAGFGALLIDGFHDYTLLEREILNLLIERIPSVKVSLLYDAGRESPDLFEPGGKAYAWFREMGFREERLSDNRRALNPALAYISENIFSTGAIRVPPADGITVIETPDRTKEIERIAREIAALVKRGEYDFQDCIVLFRRISPYLDLVREIFSRFRIPNRIFAPCPLRRSPAARRITAFLSLFLSGWKEESVIALLRQISPPGGDAGVDVLHFRAKYLGKVTGHAAWLELAKESEHEWIFKVFDFAVHWYEEGKSRRDADGACSHILFAIDRLFAEDFTNTAARITFDWGMEEDYSALREIQNIIEELRKGLEGDDSLIFTGLLRLLGERIGSGDFEVLHNRKNVVNVIDVAESRQWEKKVVFIAGLVEKEFPLSGSNGYLLNERERMRCNRAGKVFFPGIAEIYAEERFFFYVAVTRARNLLYLSCPKREDRGEELAMSEFLREFLQIVPDTRRLCIDGEEGTLASGSPGMISGRDMRRYLAGKRRGEKNGGRERLLLDAIRRLREYDEACRRVTESPFSSGAPVIRSPEILRSFADSERRYSPSQLETVSICAYRHFASYILRIETPDRVDRERLTSQDEGNIVHRVLELYFKLGAEADLEQLFEREFRRYSGRYDLSIEDDKKKRLMLENLRLFIDGEFGLPGFAPSFFEFEFGGKEEAPVFVTDDAGRKIYLRGKIDRVDLREDRGERWGIVIDYKYSKGNRAGDPGQEIIDQKAFQLPLYFIALEQALRIKPLAGIVFYLKKMEPRGIADARARERGDQGALLSGKKIREADLASLTQAAEGGIRRYAAMIERGDISLQKDDPLECEPANCAFTDLCRSQLHKRSVDLGDDERD